MEKLIDLLGFSRRRIEKKNEDGIVPTPLFPYSYQIQSLIHIMKNIESHLDLQNKMVLSTDKKLFKILELLEVNNDPSDSLEFDKLLSVTNTIAAGGSLTVGSFTVPDNMRGNIKMIGLSIPTPVAAGTTTYILRINSSPIRDWTWTHNPALDTYVGKGRGTLDSPIRTNIPITGSDIVDFIVRATVAEASASYGIRFKGWFI